MAIPAAEPAIDAEPAIPVAPAVDVDRSGSVPRRPRRGRPGRRAGAAIALVAGVSILGAGVIRTAAGLGPTASGPLAAIGVSPSATGGASAIVGPSAMPSEPSPAAGSGGPGASPSAGPSTEPVPSGPPLVPVEARLQASLDRIRAKLGIPGVSATVVLPDGTAWTRRQRSRRRGDEDPGHPGDGLRLRQREQDVHLGADPPARRRGPAAARPIRRPASCRRSAWRSTAGSPSACS